MCLKLSGNKYNSHKKSPVFKSKCGNFWANGWGWLRDKTDGDTCLWGPVCLLVGSSSDLGDSHSLVPSQLVPDRPKALCHPAGLMGFYQLACNRS